MNEEYFVVRGTLDLHDYHIVKGYWFVIYSVYDTVIDGPFKTKDQAEKALDQVFIDMQAYSDECYEMPEDFILT